MSRFPLIKSVDDYFPSTAVTSEITTDTVQPTKTWSRSRSSSRGSSSKSRSISLSGDDPMILICLTEGRGSAQGEIGFAAFNLISSTLIILQYPDQSQYFTTCSLISSMQPIEVLLPRSLLVGSSESCLVAQLKQYLPNMQITGLERKYFNDKEGLALVKSLSISEDKCASILMDLKDKYYSLASTNALIRYVEFIQCVVVSHRSVRIEVHTLSSLGICQLDSNTVRELELTRSIAFGIDANKFTLFDVMNYTKTRGGYRLLKTRILQPLTKTRDIEERLDTISELMQRPQTLSDLRTLLGQCVDLERITTQLMAVGKEKSNHRYMVSDKIYAVLAVKHNLMLLQAFKNVLSVHANDDTALYLKGITVLIDDPRFEEIHKIIGEYINPDAKLRRGVLDRINDKVQCIRCGVSKTLDFFRKIYSEHINDVETARVRACEQFSLPIKLNYSSVRGYFFTLPRKALNDTQLPSQFLKVTLTKSMYHFSTDSLLHVNDSIGWILDDLFKHCMTVIDTMLANIRPFLESLYKLSDLLNDLDYNCSMAVLAVTSDGFVRPSFAEYTCINEGRHPVFARDWSYEDATVFQSNDTRLSPSDNIMVITGANKSGKTTYMKQVALLQIMAQMGSYVPAKAAVFRVENAIFSRTGHSDDIDSSWSTYMVEVIRINQVVQNIAMKSLVIVDELGRGTSEEDGSALCFSVASYFRNTPVFVLFTSHYELMTLLHYYCPNVQNYHMLATEEGDNIIFKHELKKGKCALKQYGIKVAKMQGLSEEICTEATQISKCIIDKSKPFREVRQEECIRSILDALSEIMEEAVNLSLGGEVTLEAKGAVQEKISQVEIDLASWSSNIRYNDATQELFLEPQSVTRDGQRNSEDPFLQKTILRPVRNNVLDPYFEVESPNLPKVEKQIRSADNMGTSHGFSDNSLTTVSENDTSASFVQPHIPQEGWTNSRSAVTQLSSVSPVSRSVTFRNDNLPSGSAPISNDDQTPAHSRVCPSTYDDRHFMCTSTPNINKGMLSLPSCFPSLERDRPSSLNARTVTPSAQACSSRSRRDLLETNSLASYFQDVDGTDFTSSRQSPRSSNAVAIDISESTTPETPIPGTSHLSSKPADVISSINGLLNQSSAIRLPPVSNRLAVLTGVDDDYYESPNIFRSVNHPSNTSTAVTTPITPCSPCAKSTSNHISLVGTSQQGFTSTSKQSTFSGDRLSTIPSSKSSTPVSHDSTIAHAGTSDESLQSTPRVLSSRGASSFNTTPAAHPQLPLRNQQKSFSVPRSKKFVTPYRKTNTQEDKENLMETVKRPVEGILKENSYKGSRSTASSKRVRFDF